MLDALTSGATCHSEARIQTGDDQVDVVVTQSDTVIGHRDYGTKGGESRPCRRFVTRGTIGTKGGRQRPVGNRKSERLHCGPMKSERSHPPSLAVIPPKSRVLLPSRLARHSVTPDGRPHHRRRPGHWTPPEALTPDQVRSIIDAATCERDRLLLRVLWAVGGRISEVLELRPTDVDRGALVLANRKNPGRLVKRVALPSGQLDLPGELLVWAREQQLEPADPLFASRQRDPITGRLRPLSRVHAWRIVRDASERAGVFVLAMRPSAHGAAGEPAPAHPHLFRHARIRAILRATSGNLPLAMKQAGWSRLQTAYLTLSDADAAAMMQGVPE